MVPGPGLADRKPLRLPAGPAVLPVAGRFHVRPAGDRRPRDGVRPGARHHALRPGRDADREITTRLAPRALRDLWRAELPAPFRRARDGRGRGQAMVGPRAARQGQRSRPRRRHRQARPHVSPALSRDAGGERNPRRIGVRDDSPAAGGGVPPRRREARGDVPDYAGGAVLASSGGDVRIVTGLVKSSEFGTMIWSPCSLFSIVTRSLTSSTVPWWPSNSIRSPTRMWRSSSM